jgi:hypothetical protein
MEISAGAVPTMTTPIDFTNLTPDHQQVTHYYALDGHYQQRGVWDEAVIDALVERGILVQLERDAGGGLMIYEYKMPWAAHMAWCDWCSETLEEP